MARNHITTVGDSAALLLSQDILDKIGVHIGDEVDIAIVDRVLILRPLDEVERQRTIEAVIDDVFESRKSAYQRLAESTM
jgi:antitoxin component of MazEF toxin-antitoxin module